MCVKKAYRQGREEIKLTSSTPLTKNYEPFSMREKQFIFFFLLSAQN
jgi:hypothetical protein